MVKSIEQLPISKNIELNTHHFDPVKNEAIKTNQKAKKAQFAETKYENEHNSKALSGMFTPLPQIIIPEMVQEDVLNAVDQLGKDLKLPSISRRMLYMNQLIAELAEKHLRNRKDDEFEKKYKTNKNVQDQKSWTNWQAGAISFGGFAAPIFAVIGKAIGGRVGEGLFTASEFLPKFAQVPSTLIEGQKLPLHHDQQVWVNTLSSTKQEAEALKNAPEAIRNFILEISRAEQKAFESMGQMR